MATGYDLRRPCVDCPFRIGQGERFRLRPGRLDEIEMGGGFQCHKTVDYTDEGDPQRGSKPQECAGFMALQHRTGQWTQMMRIAERFGDLRCEDLDPDGEVYADWDEARLAHASRRLPPPPHSNASA